VVDEANLETHGFDPAFANNNANPANHPAWAGAILDRGVGGRPRRCCCCCCCCAAAPCCCQLAPIQDGALCDCDGVRAPLALGRRWRWRRARVKRRCLAPQVRMYERDKNMPAIAIWSLGNEAGYGPALAAMAGWLRARDPSRPVQYEVRHWQGGRAGWCFGKAGALAGLVRWRRPAQQPPPRAALVGSQAGRPQRPGRLAALNTRKHALQPLCNRFARKRTQAPTHPPLQGGGSRTPATDIICPMYARIPQLLAGCAQLDAGEDSRPVVLCEYAHSMGNSTGNLADYWAAFEAHRSLQGGFIWDWADQALVKAGQLADGTQVGAAGGGGGGGGTRRAPPGRGPAAGSAALASARG
jgi:beta-galactosidase/beta-glucuronidase